MSLRNIVTQASR